jgi:hypothetical protein
MDPPKARDHGVMKYDISNKSFAKAGLRYLCGNASIRVITLTLVVQRRQKDVNVNFMFFHLHRCAFELGMLYLWKRSLLLGLISSLSAVVSTLYSSSPKNQVLT